MDAARWRHLSPGNLASATEVHAQCLEAATLRSLLEDARVAAEGYQVDCCRNEAQEKQLRAELAKLGQESAKNMRSLDLLEAEEVAWAGLHEQLQEFLSAHATVAAEAAAGSVAAGAASNVPAAWSPLEWLEEKMAELLENDVLPDEVGAPYSARLCECVEADVLSPHPEHSDEHRLLLEKRKELSQQISELQQMQIRVRRYGHTLMKANAAYSNGGRHPAS